MIATITAHRMQPPISRNINSAGAPLPLIPRRILSASRSRSAPSSPPDESSSMTPIKVVVHHSTPPLGADSDSSSSSSSPDPTRPLRAKRLRGVRSAAVRPPEQSTPTPAVHEARLEQHRQPPLIPADDSTPRRPASLIYTPGISLRLATEHLKKPRNVSESHLRAPSPSAPTTAALPTSQSQPRLIRKKSGQLVKSSLKSSKSCLSVVTSTSSHGGAALTSSKSEPTTPSVHAKAVHFDAQLEHVKLFLAEQKPLAVSRDGSPTEDTSGTDTDFPSFVFGGNGSVPPSQEQRRNIVMHTPNMPLRRDRDMDRELLLLRGNADVVLEELKLAPDALSIVGVVRVRNVAYAKSVVARFTFDAWQTTSEVSARYMASPTPEVDVFVFGIRLNDLVPRIEGKRMWLAVKYVVAEREVWDNNGGRDYLAEFEVVKGPVVAAKEWEMEREWERTRERERGLSRGRSCDDSSSSSSSSAVAESDIADLRSKLEKVVVQPRRPSPPTTAAPMTTMRYDFSTGASLTHPQPWVPSTDLASAFSTPRRIAHPHPHHVRTQSYPQQHQQRPASFPPSTPARPNSIPFPEKCPRPGSVMAPPLGSPRDTVEDADALFAAAKQRRLGGDEVPFSVPPAPAPASAPVPGTVTAPMCAPAPKRNHRRGYFADADARFDEGAGAGVKRTQPVFALALEPDEVETGKEMETEMEMETETTPMPGRFYSFPPVEPRSHSRPRGLGFNFDAAAYGRGQGQGQGDSSTASESSELSTPSLGSSRETSPSPSMEGEGWKGEGKEVQAQGMSASPSENYQEFLSKFCFFTGSHPHSSIDSTALHAHNNAHTRAHTYPHLTRKTFIDVPRPHPQPQSDSVPGPYVLVASPVTVSPRSGSATPQAVSPSGSALNVNIPGPGPAAPMPVPRMFGPKAVAV